MGRLLAIDFGQKRTGIAVSDPLKMIAQGLTTVPSGETITFLTSYFQKEKVEKVIIGYPRQMNNTASESLRYINPFIKRFVKVFPNMAIEQFDERFTSKMAHQAMIDGGLKKQKRQDKGLVDKISATIILQSYMEYENNLNLR